MKIFKAFISFILAIFLMISIVLLQVSAFEHLTMLNGKFYKNIVSKNEFKTLLTKEIDFGFKNLSITTSIPESTIKDSFKSDLISKITNNNIDSTVNYFKDNKPYKATTLSSSDINTKINQYIESYAKKDNLKINDDIKQQMSVVAKDANSLVNNHAALLNVEMVSKYDQFQNIRKVIMLIYKGLFINIIAILLITIFLLLINNSKDKEGNKRNTGLLWIGGSIIAASLISLVPSLMALYFKIPSRVNIEISYLKVFLKYALNGYIQNFLMMGAGLFAFGLLLSIIEYIRLNKA